MQYEVQPGDDLNSIAERFNIPVGQLVSSNHRHLKSLNHVFAGQTLCIPTWATYTAHGGETLRDIAQRFGTTEDILVAANGVIHSPTDALTEKQIRVPYLGTYTVRSGDTLSQIGSRFGIAWPTIFEANCDVLVNPNVIFPDQKLAVPASSAES
jgi:LysM repeat protein